MVDRMSEERRPLEPGREELEALTRAVAAFVVEQVATLAEQPSFDLDGAEAVRASFREPAPEEGRSLESILARLRPAIAKSYNTAGPGYLAYIPGGGVYSAALAAFVSAATNRYVGVSQPAPALAQIEETAGRWLCDVMGLPAGARGLRSSGGSMSNFGAIVAARHEKLGEDLSGAVLYFSEETHYCVAKAARLAGLPRQAARALPVDGRRRLRMDALEDAVRRDAAAGRRPFLVVANAGTTNTGAIDPLPEVLAVARAHGLWAHVDAAYGGFFRLADGGEELLRGIEGFDSITLDPHKGLFLPYGMGALLVRDGGALACAHRESAHYVQDVAEDGSLGFADLLAGAVAGLPRPAPVAARAAARARRLPRAAHGELALARWAHDEIARDERFEIVDLPQLSVVASACARAEGRRAAVGRAHAPREREAPGVPLEHAPRRAPRSAPLCPELPHPRGPRARRRPRPARGGRARSSAARGTRGATLRPQAAGRPRAGAAARGSADGVVHPRVERVYHGQQAAPLPQLPQRRRGVGAGRPLAPSARRRPRTRAAGRSRSRGAGGRSSRGRTTGRRRRARRTRSARGEGGVGGLERQRGRQGEEEEAARRDAADEGPLHVAQPEVAELVREHGRDLADGQGGDEGVQEDDPLLAEQAREVGVAVGRAPRRVHHEQTAGAEASALGEREDRFAQLAVGQGREAVEDRGEDGRVDPGGEDVEGRHESPGPQPPRRPHPLHHREERRGAGRRGRPPPPHPSRGRGRSPSASAG
ncbi:MAG: aminotransferase class I/II-fold pyridoxal phosphate-dependent enzyme [Vicinamibacteria bacterium]